MGDNDDKKMNKSYKKAAKAPLHHSPLSEHFEGNLPLFINRWEEGFDLREHYHAYIEIVYVMAGDGYHYIGDHIERTGKGCLYVLPLGTSHIFRPSKPSGYARLLVYNLCIRPDFVEQLAQGLSLYGSGEVLSILRGQPGTYLTLIDKAMKIGPSFEQLHREYMDKRQGFEAGMIAITVYLIVQLARLLTPSTEANQQNESLMDARVSHLLDFIHTHIHEPLSVEQLASASGMSKRHFIRLFTNLTGMGFTEYLQHRRMETACRQLLETDHKIAHIAHNVGYRDIAHFRSVFRRLIGQTPREYRERGRGKQSFRY
ncbi:AraC family transcriptional regulator [Paenibacillus sp. LHD-38]|uniref:AraC family transcriptional regulator n=1 Tax=Paenibacillus sp. LHD-38 TaxID=3072143 RepID=UPI00280DF3D5|nr:AraC family transcriptional regulator [Paenibacillus sp. LHD-38]MDQ8738795.1 AraC family transcriptional regulator [Paenibacillus sp. LHD-38]